MKPRHAFLLAILASIGAIMFVEWWRTPLYTDRNANAPRNVAPQTSVSNTPSPTPTATPRVPAEIRLGNGLRFETKTIKEVSADGDQSIKIIYPQLVRDAGDNAVTKGFNHAVRRLIKQRTEEMRQAVQSEGGYVSVSYEVGFASEQLISIEFSMCSICCRAGTSGCEAFALNYDLQQNKEIKPNDLFSPRSDYIKTLMEYCEADIRRRYKDGHFLDWDLNTAKEKAKEYKQFVVTSQGLKVMFDEYAFTPGSAGIVSVLIPFDVIKDKLNPRSPVAAIARGAAGE